MGAIYYYSEFDEKWRKRRKSLGLIILLPVLMIYGLLLFQLVDFDHPMFQQLCGFWVVPSYFTANFLLIKRFFQAKSRRSKNHNFTTCLLITPLTMADLTINHLLPWFGLTVNLNFGLNIVLFISFFYIITRYGLLGKKLQIEQLDLDNSIRAMTSGTAILNHSLKNEVAKISMCATNLTFADLKTIQVKETVRIILRSTNHIMEMLDRANQCARDFTLVKSVINLKVFLEDLLAEFQDQFRQRKIKLFTNFEPEVWTKADPLHLGEVFNNLIKNALEAMESEGILELTLTATRKTATVTIKDTGIGVPGNLLPHIFEPFYSTKRSRHNFGLGLLYCYKVLKKHGGTIEVESKPNHGTTFYLNLPRYSKKR
jgi:signal transduction histidine kinase